MGPYRLPPEKSLAEQWEEVKKTQWRHLIAALILLAMITFGAVDLAIRMWSKS